jgi:predicted nucleic acid-binding protein
VRVILDPNVLVSEAVRSSAFVDLIECEAESWVDPVEVPTVTADPKDDYLVALHRSCQADLLVSGDSDLLGLAAEDAIVLTPGALMERLRP